MNPPNAILLHVCCAPCAGHCIHALRKHGYRGIDLFFANDNIHPETEYLRRLDAARTLARHESLRLIEAPYAHADWKAAVQGMEAEPEGGERCRACFAYNLAVTAHAAARHDIPAFTTTLSVSPRKPSATLIAIGSLMQGFMPFDFKKRNGYAKSTAIAKTLGLYRQSYCGCEYGRIPAPPAVNPENPRPGTAN